MQTEKLSRKARQLLSSYQEIDNQLYRKFRLILEDRIARFGAGRMALRVRQLREMNAYVKLKCDVVETRRRSVTLFRARSDKKNHSQ